MKYLCLGLLFLGIASAQAQDTVIPVTVHSNSGGFVNTPTVSVTLCAPGTDLCQTISNIQLDTGSVGLRIKSSILSPALKKSLTIKTSPGQSSVAECYAYEDGDTYWGPIAQADIKLGGEIAPNLNVQLVTPSYHHIPDDCEGNMLSMNTDGLNGVLGVAFDVEDDLNQMKYYTCPSTGPCTSYAMPLNEQVANPIFSLGTDSNGYIVEMPKINEMGAIYTEGQLTFGINTQADNTLDPDVSNVLLGQDEEFAASVNGVPLRALFDSGTNAYSFPEKKFKMAACVHYYPGFLCPPTQKKLKLTFTGENASLPPVTISVLGAHKLMPSQKQAFDQLASHDDEEFYLGMSFFYGRKIYFGFDVPDAPLGAGKHVAFKSSAKTQ